MKTNQYALDDSLGYLCGKFFRLILKKNVEKFALHGLAITSEQWMALVHLWSQDGITQHALSEMMHKDKASVTRLINSLVTNVRTSVTRMYQDIVYP
jgi:predicted transcriptional regulator